MSVAPLFEQCVLGTLVSTVLNIVSSSVMGVSEPEAVMYYTLGRNVVLGAAVANHFIAYRAGLFDHFIAQSIAWGTWPIMLTSSHIVGNVASLQWCDREVTWLDSLQLEGATLLVAGAVILAMTSLSHGFIDTL